MPSRSRIPDHGSFELGESAHDVQKEGIAGVLVANGADKVFELRPVLLIFPRPLEFANLYRIPFEV